MDDTSNNGGSNPPAAPAAATAPPPNKPDSRDQEIADLKELVSQQGREITALVALQTSAIQHQPLSAAALPKSLGEFEAEGREKTFLRQYFGSGSDSRLANRLAREDKPTYLRLRARATKLGLIR